MNSYVLDASAILALLNQEPGSQLVEHHLSSSLISAVNLSEILAVLNQAGISFDEASTWLNELLHKVIPFDHIQAIIAAELRSITKKLGLSFGDRACLGLAKHHQLPVLTADKVWAQLNIGIPIKLIR